MVAISGKDGPARRNQFPQFLGADWLVSNRFPHLFRNDTRFRKIQLCNHNILHVSWRGEPWQWL
jgi:hypothetical protein